MRHFLAGNATPDADPNSFPHAVKQSVTVHTVGAVFARSGAVKNSAVSLRAGRADVEVEFGEVRRRFTPSTTRRARRPPAFVPADACSALRGVTGPCPYACAYCGWRALSTDVVEGESCVCVCVPGQGKVTQFAHVHAILTVVGTAVDGTAEQTRCALVRHATACVSLGCHHNHHNHHLH